jgi:formyltetrahydrofolate deformylase
MTDHILTLSCDDRPGIVAGVTTALAAAGANIVEAQQYEDRARRRFFMRIHLEADEPARRIEDGLAFAFRTFGARWSMRTADRRKKVLILASRSDHCLVDLLYRWRTGELAIDPVGIVSNWEPATFADAIPATVPFHHLPVDAATRRRQEDAIMALVQETGADLVVLARYMQVLSDDLARQLAGRCVNIHHSFLPGFKGARPYHQAHARGVKLIGATAHFVTPDLDEGPIIEQDVERVSHRDTPDDLVRRGRDIERRVLARAVRLIAEDRVILNDDTTVVFD